jgi:hypothetical protein
VAIEVRAVSFSPLLTVEAVVEQVDRILTEVQAAAMWTYHVAAEVVVTDVFRVAASGSYAWIPWEREATAPGYVPQFVTEPWTVTTGSPFARLVGAQEEDRRLHDAMYYLFFRPDWYHLYKVLVWRWRGSEVDAI